MFDNVKHLKGPDGQLVVVTLSREDYDKSQIQNKTTFKTCAIFWVTLGITSLICGFISWCAVMAFPQDDNNPAMILLILIYRIEFGVGCALLLITVPIWCYLYIGQRFLVKRYMHIDDPRQNPPSIPPEEDSHSERNPLRPSQGNETFGGAVSSTNPGSKMPYQPLGYHEIPMGTFSNIMSEGVSSYYQRTQGDNIGSPYSESSVGERSFSPSSDTTYLSHT